MLNSVFKVGRRLVLLGCVAFLWAAPPAGAEWQQIPAPPGGIGDFSAASADTLIVSPASSSGDPTYSVTANRGASWSTVELTGFLYANILGAAPDGSFRVLAAHIGGASLQEFQVFKVDAAGIAEPLGSTISTEDGHFSDHFGALDSNGSVWIPYKTESTWKIEIVDTDGSQISKNLPGFGVERWDADETVFGPRAVPILGAGFNSFVPPRGTYRLGPGGSFELAEDYPVEFVEGNFWYSPATLRASWDGGAHWSELFDLLAGVVPRVGGAARFLTIDETVTQRYSSFLYAAVGAPFPPGLPAFGLVDAGDALVAHSEDALYAMPLPLAPAPTAIGQVPPDSADLVARADLFRADAGLPPLTADASISQAAHNHSAYTALHQGEQEGLSAHNEKPGNAGFTGMTPWERCEAVGTHCSGEVMYSPVADPIGGWLATVFHRFVPGGPELGLVGGGKVAGGWFVMDSGGQRNVLIQPFGYPTGRWRGQESWSGETPDPTKGCRESGQPISYPLGVTATLFLPRWAGSIQKIVMRRRGDPKPLAGCLIAGSSSFIPDEPLERGQTYDVHAEWMTEPNPQADGTVTPGITLSHDWSFYVQPDNYNLRGKAKRRCRPLRLRRIKSIAKTHRRGRQHLVLGIEEKVTFSKKAKVRLRRAQLNYWKAGKRHTAMLKLGRLRRRSVRVGRVSFLRFRLPGQVAHRVVPGEPVELRLKFTGRRADTCKRTIHVSRSRKIKIGWVHLAGPAAWVSAKHRHRHRHRDGYGHRGQPAG